METINKRKELIRNAVRHIDMDAKFKYYLDTDRNSTMIEFKSTIGRENLILDIADDFDWAMTKEMISNFLY